MIKNEQQLLEEYIKTRPLARPKTKVSTVFLWLFVYFIVGFFVASAIIFLCQINKFRWAVFILSYLLFAFIFAKKISIKAIECYQHYASEDLRRLCLCVPSCSEYAIEVLKKYTLFTAYRKIYIRLVKTCRGGKYKLDPP